MIKPIVCFYCKKKISDNEEKVQVSQNNYAHRNCFELIKENNRNNQEAEYNNLTSYIKELFGAKYLGANITKQIRDFRIEYGYTYKSMLDTLKYWYEVRNASKEAAEGRIGIIPYIHDEAQRYYEKIEKTNELNKGINYQLKMYQIDIEPPRPEEKKPKLFDLGENNNG